CVRARKIADAKNDAALITNATSRPSHAVTRPPTDAPIASIADHVAADSALAGINSWGDVMLGIVDVRAGSKNADALIVKAVTTYAIQTRSALRTSNSPRISTPRKRSAAIMRRRRLTRSTTTPASGPTSATGRYCVISI